MTHNFRYGDNSRVFTLSKLYPHQRPNLSDVCRHDANECCRYIQIDDQPRAIVVSVDGACIGNGQYWARGGYGIYFGPQSRFNVSNPLKTGPHTSQRVELMACFVALNQIEKFCWMNDSCRQLTFVIATDSAYLFNSITSYVYKWRVNNYTSALGRPVVNQDLFERIDDKLCSMAYGRQQIDVLFWKVDRSENQEADRLARMGVPDLDSD